MTTRLSGKPKPSNLKLLKGKIFYDHEEIEILQAFRSLDQTADINKTSNAILDIACNTGGATRVEQEINQLAADGKITAEQGE